MRVDARFYLCESRAFDSPGLRGAEWCSSPHARASPRKPANMYAEEGGFERDRYFVRGTQLRVYFLPSYTK